MEVKLNDNLFLINVESFKGGMHEITIGEAIIPDHKRINFTWDVANSKMMIHEWYKLTSDELATLTATLTDYFKSMN